MDFLKSEENIKCKDDQVNFNTLCRSHDYVCVDENNVIFHNFKPFDARKESDALFVGCARVFGVRVSGAGDVVFVNGKYEMKRIDRDV